MPRDFQIHLATLETPASHRNAAGRVDRSACLSLDVRTLWRHLPDDAWRPARSENKPGSRRPESRTHREAFAHLTLTAADLDRLLARALPFQLLGDFRSEKANAMKPYSRAGSARTSGPGGTGYMNASTGVNSSPRRTSRATNPNLGAAAVKVLGIPPDWSQRLRLERWRLHEKLARHFIFCPRCDSRRFKLYLPLCTPDEARDARFAYTYLNHHTHHNKPLTAHQQQLIERYANLLPPRSILCADCLNLRFGYIHPRKMDHTRELGSPDHADDPALALLALPPEARRAALLDHIATLKRRRGVHRRVNRIRNAYELIAQYKATAGDDLAFLNIARKLLRKG